MAGDPGLAADYAEDYTRSELVAFRKLLGKAILDPETVTRQEMESYSYSIEGKTTQDLQYVLAIVREAIAIKDRDYDTPDPAQVMASGFDFSKRRLE